MSMKKNEDGTECVDLWVARDKNGALFLYVDRKPFKENDVRWGLYFGDCDYRLDDSLFPEVQWSDAEPTKVKLVIDK